MIQPLTIPRARCDAASWIQWHTAALHRMESVKWTDSKNAELWEQWKEFHRREIKLLTEMLG